MTGRSTLPRELVQWSYVLMVSLALLLTAATGAAASTAVQEGGFFDLGRRSACLAGKPERVSLRKEVCEPTLDSGSTEGWRALMGSVFSEKAMKSPSARPHAE